LTLNTKSSNENFIPGQNSIIHGTISANLHKIKRIDALHNEVEDSYRIAVNVASGNIEEPGIIKVSIQKAAIALEEIYRLHGQEWMLQEIGSIIVKDLKLRGFPESKYKYVYKAIRVYEDRFVKGIDHSSIQSVTSVTKLQEQFYRTNAKQYYEAFEVLKHLPDDYNNLLRKDIQTLVPQFLDYFEDNEKLCKKIGIPVPNTMQHGFDGGPEQYSDKMQIQKPIPKLPESMADEIGIWIKSFLPALLKKLTEYPLTQTQDKRMAAGWCALRHMHDPACDDKYREHWPGWIQIVQFADQSFKHHAASHFKTQDFRGNWRKLTREQIGARQRSIPAWCKWFFDNVPGFLEEVAWFRDGKKPYTSGFSIDLSPKLSDRSIR
jgi:hypothetical protein